MDKRNILIGVSGGIAVYKIAYLVRLFKISNFNVKVVLSANAAEFVSPVTFETLSENPVYMDTFKLNHNSEKNGFIPHIHLSDYADIFVLAPATANILGKIANGIADDILSTTAIALKRKIPKLIFPAMNINMYENPINQKNIEKLKNNGYKVFEPGEGELACGVEAKGRLIPEKDIFEITKKYLKKQKLKGKKILVTSGATIEPIDPVRYITNHSTGKMGNSLAKVCWSYGADVDLVSGRYGKKVSLINQYYVDTAEDMWRKIDNLISNKDYDYIIMGSAVSDYKVNEIKKQKIKKKSKQLALKMEKTRDIIKSIREKYDIPVIGFAAETENIKDNAKKKLKEKGLFAIVANDVSRDDIGFGSDENQCTIIMEDKIIETDKLSKYEIAEQIVSVIEGGEK
jgi:phosphopantothenoylcysteine decarboxylase/phosphopantothenate--cysteine ligase